jgi:hypothetical protein
MAGMAPVRGTDPICILTVNNPLDVSGRLRTKAGDAARFEPNPTTPPAPSQRGWPLWDRETQQRHGPCYPTLVRPASLRLNPPPCQTAALPGPASEWARTPKNRPLLYPGE